MHLKLKQNEKSRSMFFIFRIDGVCSVFCKAFILLFKCLSKLRNGSFEIILMEAALNAKFCFLLVR